MRWRLYIFLLSGTAAFCFMLLTAVTDYGSGAVGQTPMVSAARHASAPIPLASRSSMPERLDEPPAPSLRIKPNPLPLFVPQGSDPVMARYEEQRDERINRGKPAHRNRLKWDEDGWHREEVALITAYCPCPKCCGTQSPGITSIGKNAWTPGLAADPIYLDYGTRVFVPGYGLSVIDDTGGAMRRHWRRDGLLHIDVRMTYHYEARQWGKRYLRVKIYDED